MSDLRKNSAPLFAVALILIGSALLLDRLDVIRFGFHMMLWTIVMVFGLVRVLQGFSRGRKGIIFWGTLLFLYGLFFLLRSSDYFDVRMGLFFPATFLIVGIALLMMFLNNYREWELLIPASLMCGIGVAFVLGEAGYVDRYDVWETLRMYWPLGLVLVVFLCLVRALEGERFKVPLLGDLADAL